LLLLILLLLLLLIAITDRQTNVVQSLNQLVSLLYRITYYQITITKLLFVKMLFLPTITGNG